MPASCFINPSSSDLDQAGVVFDLSIFFHHKTQKVLKWIATFPSFLMNYKVATNANSPAIHTHNSQPALATRTCDRCCILIVDATLSFAAAAVNLPIFLFISFPIPMPLPLLVYP
eukprot:540963_1